MKCLTSIFLMDYWSNISSLALPHLQTPSPLSRTWSPFTHVPGRCQVTEVWGPASTWTQLPGSGLHIPLGWGSSVFLHGLQSCQDLWVWYSRNQGINLVAFFVLTWRRLLLFPVLLRPRSPVDVVWVHLPPALPGFRLLLCLLWPHLQQHLEAPSPPGFPRKH